MPRSRRRLALSLTVLALLLTSCGSSSESAGDVDATQLDASYSPRATLSDAVDSILKAQKDNNPAASYALLAPSARDQYKDVAEWTKRLNELPAVTAYEVKSGDSAQPDTKEATVEHKPGLDPFKGLSAAKETQIWTGRRFETGWLVQPDPKSDPVLPSDEKASEAVEQWIGAVQACNKDRAREFQAIDNLIATAAPTLCNVKSDITVSPPTGLAQGPESSAIIDQYSTDALVWAKVVAVTSPATFHVAVAPLGDNWKVFALY